MFLLFRFLFRRSHRPDGEATPRPRAALHVCPDCRRDCVVPVDWHTADDDHWWLRLRCGECGGTCELTVTDDEAARFERDLAVGMATIRGVVAALDRESMEHELTTLVAALQRDLIDASDFARRGPG